MGDDKVVSSPAAAAAAAAAAARCSTAIATIVRSGIVDSDSRLWTDCKLRFSKLSAPSRPMRNALTTRIYDRHARHTCDTTAKQTQNNAKK